MDLILDDLDQIINNKLTRLRKKDIINQRHLEILNDIYDKICTMFEKACFIFVDRNDINEEIRILNTTCENGFKKLNKHLLLVNVHQSSNSADDKITYHLNRQINIIYNSIITIIENQTIIINDKINDIHINIVD
jgi:hypothetical protein